MNKTSNKKIAINTLYLYIRMLIVMIVSLYTSREILRILGVIDYGIYNVVGGVVSMFTFLNGTLTSSSQRYFSVELVKGNLNSLSKVFNLNFNIFSLLGIFFVLILETFGLWFVNNKMVIPLERLYAANIVYQLSIYTFLAQILTIPYNALIIAHEKMSAFSYIGIFEACIKLSIVYTFSYLTYDKLIIYGIFCFLSTLLILSIYVLYCYNSFKESHFHFYWNKQEALSIFKFSGWHFLGSMAAVCRNYGVNILINIFFNPAINAARAISFQVSGALNQFSNNFFTAVKPQIYKLYSTNQLKELHSLIERSTILSVFLISLISLPIIIETEFILGLWLSEIPDHTILFTKLVLAEGIVMGANAPTIAPALATGNIKRFELITSGINILILPISYLYLYYGGKAEGTVIILIIISILTICIQAYMLKSMVFLCYKNYLYKYFKCLLIILLSYYLTEYLVSTRNGLISFLIVTFYTTIFQLLLFYIVILNKNERKIIQYHLYKTIHKF